MPMSPTEQRTYEAARKRREVEHEAIRAQASRDDAERERRLSAAGSAARAELAETQRIEAAARQVARDQAAEREIAKFRTVARAAWPGTDAQFEAAWPALLQQHQIDVARNSVNQLHVDMRASGRYDGF